MAERLTDLGDEMEGPLGRPLWIAGLTAFLTAAVLVWIATMTFYAVDDALRGGCDGCLRAPSPFTSEWWAWSAEIAPFIAFLAAGYAASLMAIMAYLERRPDRARLRWSLAGALATAPLACIWVVLESTRDRAYPVTSFLGPIVSVIIVCMIIGMIGGAVAGAVRGGRRG